MTLTNRVFVLAMALLTALAVPAIAQTRIGDVVPVSLESPHPVSDRWRGELSIPGAALLKVHLSASQFGPMDVLRVLDGSGREVHRQVGCERWGGWLPSVEGDRVTLEVLPAPGNHPWGLRVEEVAVGRDDLLRGVPESICNLDDRQNAACYDAGMRAAGDPVGRLIFVEGGSMLLCTGSLVSPQSHLLTNNHCVSTQAGASSLEVWWRYEYPTCSGGTVSKDTVSQGGNLLVTDYNLDCSLLTFTGDTPARRYGNLLLSSAEPVLGEVIWIPQHGGGNPKTFAVLSDKDGPDLQHPAPATIRLPDVDGNAPGTDIGYYADTQGGSSGSPVLRADNSVVALHHWGTAYGPCTATDMNQGVKMSRLYPFLKPYLPACSLACAAQASASATAGYAAVFSATATTTDCTGEPTYSWNFGDGTQSAEQNPGHIYAAQGTYTWTVTVEWGSVPCIRTGNIQVSPPVQHKPGDCDGDGTVSIGEVQKAINMFLGLASPDCGVDCNGDGVVSIGEVQKVINGFLGLPANC